MAFCKKGRNQGSPTFVDAGCKQSIDRPDNCNDFQDKKCTGFWPDGNDAALSEPFTCFKDLLQGEKC